MSRPKKKPGRPRQTYPPIKLHKASGQAIVYINRRTVYLGPHGSNEALAAYAKLKVAPAPTPAAVVKPDELTESTVWTVGELLLKYFNDPGGLLKYSKEEQFCQKAVIRIVRKRFDATPVNQFKALALRECRDAMIDEGWSNGYVNRQVKRLRGMFKYGIRWQMVSHADASELKSVPSLQETRVPRTAIPDDDLEKVKAAFKTQRHRDLFDLLILTGARIGELLGLTSGCFDRSGEVWRLELKKHKTAHLGKPRVLFFHPRAQLILRRYLQADPAARLFKIRRDQVSKVFRAACTRAGVAEFTPHWLRHTAITWLADEAGFEHAQRLAGHSSSVQTEHYARKAEKIAQSAAGTLESEASKKLG